MEIMREAPSLFEAKELVVGLIVAIVLGFVARVYFTHSGTWSYSRETASKKVLYGILGMAILAICANDDVLTVPENIRVYVDTVTITIYMMIALHSSFDNDNLDNNTWVSFVKYFFLLTMSLTNSVLMAVILLVICGAMAYGARKKEFLTEPSDKITFAEIILLGTENLVLAIVFAVAYPTKALPVIVKVVVEETVFYSLNYIILFAVKEKIHAW